MDARHAQCNKGAPQVINYHPCRVICHAVAYCSIWCNNRHVRPNVRLTPLTVKQQHVPFDRQR